MQWQSAMWRIVHAAADLYGPMAAGASLLLTTSKLLKQRRAVEIEVIGISRGERLELHLNTDRLAGTTARAVLCMFGSEAHTGRGRWWSDAATSDERCQCDSVLLVAVAADDGQWRRYL